MPGLLRAAVLISSHLLPKDVHLGLVARLDPGLRRSDPLGRQGKRYPLFGQYLVGGVQEGQRPSKSQVGSSLIDQLLELHGRHTAMKGAGHHGPERVQALTAQQRGQDGKRTGLIIQFTLPKRLVKGKIGKEGGKLRVRLRQAERLLAKFLAIVRFRLCGQFHKNTSK